MNKATKLCVIAVCSIASCGSASAKGVFELGLAADFRSLKLKSDAIPSSVMQEAQDPSIVNPYSGNYFGKDTIGTYDPKETFRFLEAGVFGQYTFDFGSPLKPYLRGEFQYPFVTSTHEGDYGEGYTYEKILGSGVDDVRYTYGIEYKYAYFFEPEVGLRYEADDTCSISFGIGFQRLELEYYKGIEAYGKTQYLYKLDSSTHDLFNYKLRISADITSNLSFSVEPSYTNGNGVEGYGIAFSMCQNY